MKCIAKLLLITLIFASASVLNAKDGDECDVKHPYHPIVQDAKLIASYAKIWWITEKMKKHASGDADQQKLLTDIQNNAHEMKEKVINALTQRVQEKAVELNKESQKRQVSAPGEFPEEPLIFKQ
jgi:hypothetical protein